MKRTLALILVLCTLLCLFPVAISANEGGEGGAEASTTTYVDLYVKEGLVALFDGYSLTASTDEAKNFVPVDLYGKEGYTSYLKHNTDYYTGLYYATNQTGTVALSSSRVKWQTGDGYLALVPSGNASGTQDAFLWTDLGADIGQTYSVQEIWAYDGTINKNTNMTPSITDNGDGTYTVNNFASIGLQGAWMVGNYGTFRPNIFHVGQHQNIFNGYLCNQYYTNDLKNVGQMYFNNSYYGAHIGNDYFKDDGTVLNGYYVFDKPAGIIERTLSRYGAGTVNEDETVTVKYNQHFQFPATTKYGTPQQDWPAEISVSASEASKTSFYILADEAARVYSVRFYNKVLTAIEIEQNHLADLAAFYALDGETIDKILAFDANQFATLLISTSTIAICPTDKTDADAYNALKDDLLAAIAAAEEATVPDYVPLYVADGLVALYDAYGNLADDAKLDKIFALNLEGAEGYDDYANIFDTVGSFYNSSKYDWRYVNGGFAPVMIDPTVSGWTYYNYLNLTNVSALLGDTYSIQEVFTHDQDDYVIEDGVITNYDSVTIYGRGCASWIGGINYSSTPQKGLANATNGVYNVLGMVSDQIQFGSTYISHFYWADEKFGTTHYDSLTANNGELTFENYYVGADRLSIERTVSVLGAYKATTTEKKVDGVPTQVDAWEATFRISFAQAPGARYDYRILPGVEYTAVAEQSSIASAEKLQIAGDHATYHSIRVYNKDLNKGELAQNHLADLVAYYGISPESFLAMPAEFLAILGERFADMTLTPAEGSDEYLANVEILEYAVYDLAADISTAAENVIDFGGISYRTSGDYGVRACFTVDAEAIAFLESCGYTVVYGAVVGIKGDDELTVDFDEETGKAVITSGKGAIISTDSEAGIKYLTEDNVSFALTTTFAADGTQSDYYETELVYRGFALFALGGESAAIYDDVDVADLDTVSLVSVHEYVLETFDNLTPELIERLEAILPTEE